MLQMHHVGWLRKLGQAVDNNMATCSHPGGLSTESRREDHGHVASPAQRTGKQFDHRFGTRKVRDIQIGDQYSQIRS